MLNDASASYRWQDHVITPRRAARNLKATALVIAVIAIAANLFGGHGPDPVPAPVPAAPAALAIEQPPSLAESVKRPVSTHPGQQLLRGC